jgi:hypothetical protein
MISFKIMQNILVTRSAVHPGRWFDLDIIFPSHLPVPGPSGTSTGGCPVAREVTM